VVWLFWEFGEGERVEGGYAGVESGGEFISVVQKKDI